MCILFLEFYVRLFFKSLDQVHWDQIQKLKILDERWVINTWANQRLGKFRICISS